MNERDRCKINMGQLYDKESLNLNDKFIGYKKLNQLININRNGITSLMIDLMDKMLSISQKYIYNSKEKVKASDLYNTVYHISANELLGSRSRKNFSFIQEQVKKISELRIECIDDKYNFGVINIFQSLYYNSYEDRFEYTINTEITESFYDSNSIIGISPHKNKKYFTDISEKFEIDVDFKNDNPYHLFEWFLMSEYKAKSKGFFIQKFEIDLFKKMIGVNPNSYSNLNDLRKRVLKPTEKKLKEEYGCPIEINITGMRSRGGIERKKYIEVKIFDRNYLAKLKKEMELECISEDKIEIPKVQYDDDFIDYQYDNYILPDGFGVK